MVMTASVRSRMIMAAGVISEVMTALAGVDSVVMTVRWRGEMLVGVRAGRSGQRR